MPDSDLPDDSIPVSQEDDQQQTQEVTETHPESESAGFIQSEPVPEPIPETVAEEAVYEQIDTTSEPQATRNFFED